MPTVTRNRRLAIVLVGVLIIVLPLIGVSLEGMLGAAAIVLAGIVIVPAYTFLVIMAATGLFGTRAAFLFVTSLRGPFVGIAHGLSVVSAALSLALGNGLEVLFIPFVAATIGLYLWLVFEWALAVHARGGPRLQAQVGEA